MQCYLLPNGLLEKLLCHIRMFFWSREIDKRHIHLLSWDRLSKPKEAGDSGFRDLRSFNLALLAKQARKGSRPFWLWQSILHGRDLLIQGVRWQEIANDAKVIKIDDQLLVLIKRHVETELMLEEKFRYLCDEVSNFVKEIEDGVKEVERLSCKDVAKKTVRLFRRGHKRELYKMTCLQMMVNESYLSVREKHTFVSKMNLGRLD
ncbi:hypothetical protein Tco_1231628 [Tanacetum coccineum]